MDAARTPSNPEVLPRPTTALRIASLGVVLDALPTGAIVVDSNGIIVCANARVDEIFGSGRGGLLGHSLEALIPTSRRAQHHKLREGFMGDERPQRMGHGREFEAQRRNGEVFPVEVGLSRMTTEEGPVVLATIEDITARRAREEALRTSEERFLQLVENIREVFWLIDPEGARLVYLSPVAEALFGRTSESLLHEPAGLLAVVHPEDQPRIARWLATEGVDHGEVEYRALRPDGTVRQVRSHAYPVRDAKGSVIRVAGVTEDVTDRRLLEAQLRQTQKMESIGLLAGGVAHDFNNWLTVIAGNTDALLSELTEQDPLREHLHEIRQAGERAASLTRQLLAFSRQQVMEPRVLDLAVVLSDTERMLARLLGDNMRLSVSAAPRLSCVVADTGLVVQVLVNLVLNARDAMPRGGVVSIRVDEVSLDDEAARVRPGVKPGRYVRTTVTDTGTGMTPEVRARLFEPFFTTKGPGKGTGLGLAVVHGIITQSGGHIEVRSEVDRGTSFELFLPAVDARPVESRGVDREARLHGGHRGTETVLLVEDEASVRRVAHRTLAGLGYVVLQADGATEALRMLDECGGAVDLLVTDVVMPGIGGRELADAVAKRYPDVRVLFTSGYAADAAVRLGALQAEVAFLQKPYSREALTSKVREVLDRAPPMGEARRESE